MSSVRQAVGIVILALSAVVVGLAACSPDTGIGTDGDADSDADSDADGDGDGDGSCSSTEPYCSPDAREVLMCNPVDGSVIHVMTCPPEQTCIDGACATVICTPGEFECIDSFTENRCAPDGLAWVEQACAEGQRCLAEDNGCGTPCVLRVFILLDSSGSMGGDVEPTKWTQAREALAALMATSASHEVEFGFGTFPTGGSCGTESQIIHPVPEATAANVDSHFTTFAPSGSTPLLAALQLHLDDTAANLNDPAYANFILLVSDGSDTCWEENCIAECGIFNILCIIACEERADAEVIRFIGETSATLRDEAAIRTFVIGFGSGVSEEELQAVAENGGTVLGSWLPASNVAELSTAFSTVLDEMLECNPIVY